MMFGNTEQLNLHEVIEFTISDVVFKKMYRPTFKYADGSVTKKDQFKINYNDLKK